MGDTLEDLIARIDTLSLEQVHAGELKRLSLRQSHLGAAISEIALRLVTQPHWTPTSSEKGEIGMVLMALHEAQTGEPSEPSHKLALADQFISNVRRAFKE